MGENEMKKVIAGVSASLFMLMSNLAHADGECDKYKTSYDKTYCMAKIFMEADKELNTVYSELRGVLKDDLKKQLTETQRAWLKYRDSSCEQSGSIDVSCNYKVNKERTDYLRDRLRECKAGTCRNELIAQKNWG